MLRLINIEKTDEAIRAEYIPEASEEVGTVVVSLGDADIIDSQKTSYDGTGAMYLRHAAEALKKMANEATLPKTRLIMWY